MRVNKNQIVHGVLDYIQGEILTQLGDDKAMQIIMSIAANAAMANHKLIDTIMDNDIVRVMLNDDGSGTYDVDGIVEAMRTAIGQYGNFPIKVPAIPLLSPREITLTLDAADVDALKHRIENAM